MSDSRSQFKAWFEDPLDLLKEKNDTGFVLVMVSLSLLERYVRNKIGMPPKETLGKAFYDELAGIFPRLGSRAKDFWSVFRNGLLHQVSFSPETRKGIALPPGALTHAVDLLQIEDSGEFRLNPRAFWEAVRNLILCDFHTYEGRDMEAYVPLPIVGNLTTTGSPVASGSPFLPSWAPTTPPQKR